MEKQKTCKNCRHWQSFADRYEDPLEDHDSGFCNINPARPSTVSSDHYCSCFMEIGSGDSSMEEFSKSQLPRTRFVVSLQVNVPAGERSMIWKNHERIILRYPPDSTAFDLDELVNAHVDKDKIKLGLSLVEQLQQMVDRFIEVQSRNAKD